MIYRSLMRMITITTETKVEFKIYLNMGRVIYNVHDGANLINQA